MELKESNSNNNSNSKRIIIKEEIDEGVVEAIVEIVVGVEMDVEMETETTTRTIIMVVEIVEMEMVVLRKRNVEDVIGEEIEKVVVEMEMVVVEGIITMVEIPSKVMEEEEEGINRRMAKHIEI